MPCSGRNAWGETGHGIRWSTAPLPSTPMHRGTLPIMMQPPPFTHTLPEMPPSSPAPSCPHTPAGPPGSTRPSSCPAQRPPSPSGPAAPAPGAGHGRTQLGSSGSRRASHRLPVLALNAGTCSPTVPNQSRTAREHGASYPPLSRAVYSDPASLPGRSIPGRSSSSPAASG